MEHQLPYLFNKPSGHGYHHYNMIPMLETIAVEMVEVAAAKQVYLCCHFPPSPVLTYHEEVVIKEIFSILLFRMITLVQCNTAIHMHAYTADRNAVIELTNKATLIGMSRLQVYFEDRDDLFHTGLAKIIQLTEQLAGGEISYGSNTVSGNYFKIRL